MSQPNDPNPKDPVQSEKPTIFPWWANPFRSVRHPIKASRDISGAGKDGVIRFGKDVWYNFASVPMATVEALQSAAVQYKAESEFEKQVRYRVWMAYFFLGTAAMVIWWGLWTLGVNNAIGSLAFFAVGALWFLRVRGIDPVKNWIRANLEEKHEPGSVPTRPNISPAVQRAMLRLRIKQVGAAIDRWENLKPVEQEDDAVILAHQIIQVLVDPLEKDLVEAPPETPVGTGEEASNDPAGKADTLAPEQRCSSGETQ